jgi:hypothetical protein
MIREAVIASLFCACNSFNEKLEKELSTTEALRDTEKSEK